VERQGDYSGRRDWPGGGQSNWLLTGFDSRSKWLGRVTTVNIALDRDKPIPLARQIQAHLERLIRERLLAPGMKLPATRELAHSLGVNRGTVDSELFPTHAFRPVLTQVLRDEGASLLQYYPACGYPPLRRYLSTYLLQFGLEARPEEILIVNGSQQGFDLIARTLNDPANTVAIEQPTYPRALQVFRSFGAQLAP